MGGKGSGRKPAPCGTTAAYRRHRQQGEEACQACKAAWAAYYAAKYQRKTSRLPKGLGDRYAKQRARHKQYRDHVNAWKLAKEKCADCGKKITVNRLAMIDCDHRDPDDKSFTISYMVGRKTVEELDLELAKCDAVCRNCHSLRTNRQEHHLRKSTRQQRLKQPELFDA